MEVAAASPVRYAGVEFPLALAEVRADPYPYYAWLRENDPCHRAGGAWLVSRHADVDRLLRDKRLSSDQRKANDPILFSNVSAERGITPAGGGGVVRRLLSGLERRVSDWAESLSMIGLDAPDHTRMRKFVSHAFTPAAVRQMEAQIRATAESLLEDVRGRPFDVIAEYGYPLPLRVVADLLGVPTDDLGRMRRWSDALSRAIDPAAGPAVRRQAALASVGFNRYLARHARSIRRRSADDLFARLVRSNKRERVLSTPELFGNTVLLLVAGHETTTNLIGNGLYALLRHPDQLELLVASSDLTESAVEEMLRWDSPGQLTYRTALEDFELHGREIRRGEQLILLVGSANRDPEVYESPDEFRIDRLQQSGAKHIAFGAGPHFCLGAPLARLEGRLAFEALLLRGVPRQLTASPQFRDNLAHRGLTELRIEL